MVITEENPRLRSDLCISPQKRPEGTFYVVKDRASERFFQWGEAEYFIARQLDGETPLEVVRERTERELGAALDEASLVQFVERLERLGLMEGEKSGKTAPAPRRRIRGSLLYLRLGAFDPNRLFDRIIPKLGFFFTPQFLVLSALVIAAAAAITYSDWPQILHAYSSLFHFRSLVFAYFTLFVIIAAHEFAHGLTCKHFGGEVHEIGFLLIYFEPAFYCNVSDAWLFPEKSRRLWVTFAGGYFEFFLWGLATLAWRLTEPGTAVNSLSLMVMLTSGFKILFNVNPLIKLDGYYLLSDFLEVPNLRKRSFAYLKNCLQRLIPGSHVEAMGASPRERRIFLAYGLLAGTYSYWLLSMVALWFGQFLVARYHGFGFLIFITTLGVLMRDSLKRLFKKPAAVIGPIFHLGSGPGRRWRALGWLSAVAALSILLPLPLKVGGEFKILPDWNADVCAEVDGVMKEVYVEEGQKVHRGQPLAEISDRDYRSELEKVQSDIAEKQAKLAELERGPTAQEVAVAERDIETAQAREIYASAGYREAEQIRAASLERASTAMAEAQDRLNYAPRDLSRYEQLFKDGLVSAKRLDDAREEVEVDKKQLAEKRSELEMLTSDRLAKAQGDVALSEKEQAEARARLGKLLAGTRPEVIAQAQAALEGFYAQEQLLEDHIRHCTLSSPTEGVIATHRPREMVGHYVKKGDLIVKVDELAQVQAEITVPESEVADVHVGEPLVLKARAFPGQDFSGKVTAIAPVASADPALPGKQFLVTTTLDNPGLLLKSDMSGNAKIYCGRRSLVGLIGRKLSKTFRVEFWSWW